MRPVKSQAFVDRLGFGSPTGRGRANRRRRIAGDHVDQMEILRLERGEQGRQHVRGLLLDVMQQDDAASGAAQPAHQQVQLRLRRHRGPVGGP